MKKTLELHFLPIAEEDITAIVDFIAQDKISAAVSFYDKLEKRMQQLVTHPFIGTKRTEPELSQAGYYSLVYGNYIIFYTIKEKAVIIHRVLSGYRDYIRFL